MTFRKILFWVHLACGLAAGLVIAIMSFTGAALAFEKEITAWAERDVARVTVPAAETPRVPVDELVRRIRATQPDVQPVSVMVKNDPAEAYLLTTGTGSFYVNPYTGELRPPGAEKTRAFMRTMNAWHRTLALTGDNRALGRIVTGACNVAFLGLALTGLYLWMPRKWSWPALRPLLWFAGRATGRARDWNWHNVIGLWSAPVFIALTITALPLSYLWAGDLINKLNPPENTAAGANPSSAPAVSGPTAPAPPGAKRLDFETLLTAAQQQVPDWKQITLRLDGGSAAGGRGGGGRGERGGGLPGVQNQNPNRGEGRGNFGGGTRNGAPSVSLSIREAHSWPRTATTTLVLDPFTGAPLSREGFANQALGRQVRSWTRFLHTGEALGPLGQFFAGLACLGACVLVWTGFALAWRRFFGRRVPSAPATTNSIPVTSGSTGG